MQLTTILCWLAALILGAAGVTIVSICIFAGKAKPGPAQHCYSSKRKREVESRFRI